MFEDGQQDVSDQGQIRQQVRVAGTRAVFAHQGITPPVVAVFDSGPVAANQV